MLYEGFMLITNLREKKKPRRICNYFSDKLLSLREKSACLPSIKREDVELHK
jgi:hypothetical protein